MREVEVIPMAEERTTKLGRFERVSMISSNSSIGKRTVGGAILLLGIGWSMEALAGPQEWYEEGLGTCIDGYLSPGDTFRCNICGVEAGCNGDACFWGSMDASLSGGLSEALSTGYQAYCVNQGGAVLPTESPAGTQLRSADAGFSSAERGAVAPGRGGLPLSLGGVFNYAFGETQSAYGATLPWATGYAWSSSGVFDLSGAALAATTPGFEQFGASVRPGLRVQSDGSKADATRVFFGLAAPALLTVNTGDALDTSLGFQGGGAVIAGLSFPAGSSRLGAGVAVDALYANTFRLPTQLLLRYAAPGSIVLQPGLSLDPVSGGISDTMSINALAGFEVGNWVLGAQGFLRSGANGVGLGATHQGDLARTVAAGRLEGAADTERSVRVGDRVVIVLTDGQRVEGTLVVLKEGAGYRVRRADGFVVGMPWHRVASARVVADEPARGEASSQPASAKSLGQADRAWQERTGARFSLGIAAQGMLSPRWIPVEQYGREESLLRFGGGGGVAFRLGTAILTAPAPSQDDAVITGLQLGSGVELGAIAAQDSMSDNQSVTAAFALRVPAYFGFVVGGGHFEEQHARWRGVIWGLHYEPSYTYLGYDVETAKWDRTGVTRYKPARGMINLLGLGTTFDLASLDTARGIEPNLRFHASCALPYGENALIATLGLGAVWY